MPLPGGFKYKVMVKEKFDGQTLKGVLELAEVKLKQHEKELNRLNVFPVPDGDTGTNMYLTLQAAKNAVTKLPTNSAATTSATMARGALLGARGNSGVILSQILRGIAKGLEAKERFSSLDFARALHIASETAQRAIVNPVEGTILTVVREASEKALQWAEKGANLKQTLVAVVAQARETVKRTPELLPPLKEAGVVDAGGKGLLYVFQGMKEYIGGKMTKIKVGSLPQATRAVTSPARYGFDLQFLIKGDNLPLEEIRHEISQRGESVLVVGDEKLIRVHIHTPDPKPILDYAASLGSLEDIQIEDMDEQVKNLRKQKGG